MNPPDGISVCKRCPLLRHEKGDTTYKHLKCIKNSQMDDFESYASQLEGSILTNLYFTKQDGPYNYRPGIAPAYYFSTIMELDGETLLRFEDDFIVEWKHESALTELTNENWALPDHIVFKGQPIAKVVRSESGQLTFHLKNGTTIAHVCGDGDQLVMEKK